MPKLFLSFATEDYDFVIKLYSRLRRLRLDIWDYSKRDDEIPPGEETNSGLGQAILDCDYFIPIITCNSARECKKAIQFEIGFAFKHKKLFCPVAVATRMPNEWPGAFGLLSGKIYLNLDPCDDKAFERKIQELCAWLGVDYEPDSIDHHWLPLYKRFQEEIEHHMAQIANRKFLYKYDEWLSLINDFNRFYSQGKWARCLKKIDLLLDENEEHSLIGNLYYPLIVKGACELELGKLEQAKATFLQATKAPGSDENAFGGLGHVYFHLGDQASALEQYVLALRVCPPGKDGEIIYNLFLTAVEILKDPTYALNDALLRQARGVINDEEYSRKMLAIPDVICKERWAIEYLIGLGCQAGDRIADAYACFSRLYERAVLSFPDEGVSEMLDQGFMAAGLQQVFTMEGFLLPVGVPVSKYPAGAAGALRSGRWVIADGDSIYELRSEGTNMTVRYRELSLVINLAGVLESRGRSGQAATLLRSDAVALNSRLLFHHYANVLIRMKDRSGAMDVYANSLAVPPYDVQYLVEYALFLRYFGCKEEMTRICTLATGLNDEGEKKKKYYIGYAWFLLGKLETAQILFEQSGPYSIPYE